jgi:hypothetical protein
MSGTNWIFVFRVISIRKELNKWTTLPFTLSARRELRTIGTVGLATSTFCKGLYEVRANSFGTSGVEQ